MTDDITRFAHRFVPAEEIRVEPQVVTDDVPPATVATAATFLLMHGTGGDEHDLLPLGVRLAAGAGVNLLGVRGRVSENGARRFFRRLREGVFDEADVVRRAGEIAEFAREASARYGFDCGRIIAVGYSNGANTAAAVTLLHPATFSALVLFHAQPVLSDAPAPRLDGKKVFITGGQADPIVPANETERLAATLRLCGAEVKLAWQPGGHALTSVEVEEARAWLAASGLLTSHAT
jgi:phospholipase/carboxylesterase